VVEYQPWRRLVGVLVALTVASVCLGLGYTLGENRVFAEWTARAILSDDLETADTRIRELEMQLESAELVVEVQRDASNELRGDMSALHEHVEQLEEEVTFYKSLMAPGDLSAGLQITELEIVPGAHGQYRFALLLTQQAIRRQFISGQVRIELHGIDDSGKSVVKPFTELVADSTYPLRFKFRFFQDLVGTFVWPEGVQVSEFVVVATQNGQQPLTARFPWSHSSSG
jgi:hypothetical protein